MIKMNRLLILLIGCLCCFSCVSKTDGFKVKMHLENAPECEIFVSERIPNPTQWYIDTLELKNGQVVYTGKVDYPRLVSFVVKKGEDDFVGSFSIFLDNSEVEVQGDFNNLKNLAISGSKTHDEFVAIEKNGQKFMKEYGRIGYDRSKAFKDNRVLYDSLAEPYRQAYDKVVDYILNLPGYAHSEVAPYFVSEYISADNLPLMEKALNAFDVSLAENAYIANCRVKLEKEKRVQPGVMAYDFTLEDLEGNTYKLSDYRGKYVLLEFSASWCGWCKLEIPFLETVYKNTQGKNFVMFTINLDDERGKWEEDVKHYNLPWKVISDLKAFESPVAKSYNVSGIPMIYLIDPEGKIKEKGLRREEMIEYINALFE